MKAEEFDEGSDITAHLDLSKARRIKQEHKRVNVEIKHERTFQNVDN
jgi:hypothetical protein